MRATVRWSWLTTRKGHLWRFTRVLYSYASEDRGEILYIGKADGASVRQRFTASDKKAFWDDLEEQRGICREEVLVLVGDIELEEGMRLTRELLFDIESLLIKRVRPWGNRQSIRSRIPRPGLRVKCLGDWPLAKRQFYDAG
jgi:hypothetical protein